MTSYLIAHKVRGQAAFDVAERMTCPECNGTGNNSWDEGCVECEGEGYWWIIPTSGHRAYPYAEWKLEDLVDTSDYPHPQPWRHDLPPPSLPDHYPANKSPNSPSLLAGLFAALAPKQKVTRR